MPTVSVSKKHVLPGNIKAVIFDCDGTLVDSEVISMRVLQSLAAEHGLQLSFEEAMNSFAGNELAVVLQILETKLGSALPDDFLDTFRGRQLAELADSLQAIDGVNEVLPELCVPFCVASNAPLTKVELCLNTTGLNQYFSQDRIFSAYTIERWKPEPDLFLAAADAMQIAPADCVVVEDSSFGIEAGLSAGMHVLGYDPHDQLSDDFPAVVMCKSFSQFRNYLPMKSATD